MTWEAWLTLAVVVAVVVGLLLERLPPAVTVLGGVTVLLTAGILGPQEAFAGFSNPAPITVAALFVFARAVEVTGALDSITARALPRGRAGERRSLARIGYPTAAASAFLNNTPIVAMVAPRVAAWARDTGRSPSRFLIPLSYATILGGLITVIGTSTNLVVSGLLVEAGLPGIGLFELARLGVPLAIVGVTVIVLVAPLLLPTRRSASDDLSDAREFTVEMMVEPDSPLAGSTVNEAQLRNLQGVFLVELERDGRRIAPVTPDEVLEPDDRLVFAGNVERIVDLQRRPGLMPAEHRHFAVAGTGPDRRFYQAVVSATSQLAGATLKEVEFRSRYHAAVVAIHRAGERVPGKLGDIDLRPGDVLLLIAGDDFDHHWRDHHDFLLVTPLDGSTPTRTERAWVVQLLAAALLIGAGTGLVDILVASLLVAVGLVVFRVLSLSDAKNAVDTDIVVLIAASFGLGIAIQETGLAQLFADGITAAFSAFGDVGTLAGILLATMLLTGLISNNAAAVLMFPIAIATADAAGLDPRPFAIAVAVGASADFVTPIGYQTNTMVYGMGGYRFTDFTRAGFPLTIVTIVASLILIPLGWPLR